MADHKLTSLITFVTHRLAAGASLVMFTWFWYSGEKIWDAALGAGGVSLLIYLAYVISVPITVCIDENKDKSLIKNIIDTSAFIILYFYLIDLILLRGTYLLFPSLSLIGLYPYEDTYWGCEVRWVIMDEGSICRDWY